MLGIFSLSWKNNNKNDDDVNLHGQCHRGVSCYGDACPFKKLKIYGDSVVRRLDLVP